MTDIIKDMMDVGWTFRPATLRRSDLVRLAQVFVEIHGAERRVAIVRDLRKATSEFVPLEDNGIQAITESSDPKSRWYLRDLIQAMDLASEQ
jgi:hypothetical protein